MNYFFIFHFKYTLLFNVIKFSLYENVFGILLILFHHDHLYILRYYIQGRLHIKGAVNFSTYLDSIQDTDS